MASCGRPSTCGIGAAGPGPGWVGAALSAVGDGGVVPLPQAVMPSAVMHAARTIRLTVMLDSSLRCPSWTDLSPKRSNSSQHFARIENAVRVEGLLHGAHQI